MWWVGGGEKGKVNPGRERGLEANSCVMGTVGRCKCKLSQEHTQSTCYHNSYMYRPQLTTCISEEPR